MGKHNGLKAAVAAFAAVATLAGVAGTATAAEGKDVAALSVHGGAQRIAAVGSKNAKNVILFIGDGMGDSEITVARNYLHGLNGKFEGIDRLGQPTQGVETGVGQYTTFSLGNSSNDGLLAKKSDGTLAGSKTAGVLTPVTDSSASGSGWATGTKTYNNAVDIDVKGNPQLNLIELAKAAGKATGNVTTAEIQDATPAVLESHSSERACYGPQGKWDGKTDTNKDGKIDASDGAAEAAKRCLADQLKANGGIGSISEQLLDTRADVTIGGGAKYFNQFGLDGKTLWDQAAARGFQTVKSGDVNGFKNLSSADQTKPVLALLGDGNLPTEFNPSVATKQDPKKDENPTVCTVNQKWLGNQGASLADFTSKSIDLLQKNPNGQKNGYFLQVEGASIDKQDHNANACGQIGETDDLDKAISAALAKVDLSNTLVIVTADHAHTSQIVESQPIYALSTVLKNRDGSKTVISYGTSEDDLYGNGKDTSNDVEGKADPSDAQGNMSHTGTQLRIAASGPNASRVDGLTDQTDNFYTIGNALGLATSTDAQKKLSDGAQVSVEGKDGAYTAKATGFNGDAVLAYQLTDASGKVVDQSASSTPLSGVRVQTAGTTEIALKNAKEGYKLTVTGRQSGKTVTVTLGEGGETPTPGQPEQPTEGKVPVYRLHKGSQRLLTADENEYKVLQANGWIGEGAVFDGVPTDTKDATKVYRLRKGTVFLYTADENEYKFQQSHGWTGEDVAFALPADGTLSVYRLRKDGNFLYTSDENEYKVLQNNGWTGESVAFKAYDPAE
ncbi:alkaline phosphatase [Bifidobacterium sp. UTCIF-37]|uniref:alkaline phosphatase n=1 Tax=unclassified Bifidobacterium TaxID=2608897 RepID=UPI00112ABDE6|nr:MULTISPECIES: alkaline phosphatase [unclassified Bifidobacterium]TPF85533.1 alkaline phosphatase [Bifidobacterium sp. UTCIF-37]TPF87592.1 alkaline phosphatase [Bifidobacterium sp. UTCIF-38]